MRRAFFAVVAGAALAAACSLTGVERLAIKACVRDEQCETLNRANGIGRGVCERFYCNPSTRQCDVRVRSDEVCDGVDNDCDGLVDEGVLAAGAVTIAVSRVGAGSRVRFSSDGAAALVASDALAASYAPVSEPGGVEQTASALPYRSQSPSRTAAEWWMTTPIVDGCDGGTRCTVFEGAFAPAPADQWFVAAVDTESCGAGRLRLGLREGAALMVRGPNNLSNSWNGVDLTDEASGRCGGASRAAGPRGVVRPAVQRLPGAPQALVAWLGDRARASSGDPNPARGACGGTVAPVEALVAHHLQAALEGMTISWITTSDSARPVTLGRTLGGGAPATLSLEGGPRGYFVAFGDAEGGVALRFVGPAPAPPPVVGVPSGLRDDLRPTEPMPAPVALTLARGGTGTADHVSLFALPGAGSEALTLGVAWVEGCGAPSGSVYFASVRYEGGAFRELSRALVATGASLTATAVALVPNAVAPGLSPHAVNDETRAWLVAYVSAGALRARRVALGDGALLDEPSVEIATGLAPDGLAPVVLGPSGALPARAVWFSPARGAIETAALCGAPDAAPGGG